MSKIDLTITEDIKKKFLYNKSKYLSSLEKNKKVEVITIDDDSDEISQEKIEKLEQETKQETKQETNLEGLTLAELKVLAKEKEIKGYSTMKKADLLEALR